MRKSFSGAAVPTTLTSNIGTGDTTIFVASISNWPNTTTGPFVITIDKGLAAEEKVLCQSYTGNWITVSPGGRGYDGTAAQAHTAPATVNCTLDANTIDTHDAFVAGVGTLSPTTSHIGDTAFAGNSGVPADAYHSHGREQFATGASSTSAVGDSATDGTSNSPARADHKHGRESYATLTGNLAYGTVTPSNSNPGDAAAAGSATTPARADHVHGRETLGTLGYAQITASQSGITSLVDVTGLTTTVTVGSGRRIKVTGFCPSFSGGTFTDMYNMRIVEGSTTLAGVNLFGGSSTVGCGGPVEWIGTPSAGSHTYKIQATHSVGAASGTFQASATQPAFILVQDIGT